MSKNVVLENKMEVSLEEVSTKKGYIMKGNKGDFVLARDTEGRFIWVRINPPKTTKVYHAFDTIKDAIKSKLEKGYEVIEIDETDII